MKTVCLIGLLLMMNSCNTTIGLYRDTKAFVLWTKDKIQGTGGGGGDEVEYDHGAPIY